MNFVPKKYLINLRNSMKLNLLFTKDGLQYQLLNGRKTEEENSFFIDSETVFDISQKLKDLLSKDKISEISVVSAINHFTVMPDGFSEHEVGYDLIAYNSNVDKNSEELMLSVNKKFGVQFYYTFPKNYYSEIKNKISSAKFNFSGEKFLNSINAKNGKEIHINLYHNQCEFFALNGKK